jgi:hypothetical protein
VRRWYWLLALGLMSIPAYAWRHGVPSHATAQEKLPAPRPALAAPQYVGAGSCAASACHGARGAISSNVGEFTTWVTHDLSHSQAYEVLFADRSKQIQKRLGQKIGAHEDQRCLSCHVAPDFDVKSPPEKAPYFKTDGISCESCHGPAKHWINHHHLKTWQTETPEEKKRLGMNGTRSLVGRAQLCVRCHVGEAGMDVDHDLIAAGHPRLHFEFAAFHAHMPRHWPDAKDRTGRPDFEARVWAVGQLATAQAALELLAYRVDEKHQRPWPEFAEHDCLSCHHDLRSPSWRQQLGDGKRQPGAIPWSNPASLAPRVLASHGYPPDAELAALIAKIKSAFDARQPNRKQIAQNAKTLAALLGRRLHELDNKNLDEKWVDQTFQSILKNDAPKAINNWDDVTRVQLSLAALHLSRKDSKAVLSVRDLQNPILDFSLKVDGPQSTEHFRSFEPAAIHQRLLEFGKLNGHRD